MKVKTITYPSDLEQCNKKNDNIDVFVKLENGNEYCVSVATIEWVISDIKDGFRSAGAPEIIVSELQHEIIERAIDDYSADDAYWLRVYSISCGDSIPE